MDSPLLKIVPPGVPLRLPGSQTVIGEVVRMFIWVLFSGLIGVIFIGMPPALLEFYQKPVGMSILIFGIMMVGLNFKFNAEILFKVIAMSIGFTAVVQLGLVQLNKIWPSKKKVLDTQIRTVLAGGYIE